jgi:saccharopine dehydrogenase (NAD+, L-lysine-forming)
VDEIHIRAGAAAPSPGSPPVKGPGMTIRTVLDEYTMNPIIFENGQYKEVPILSGKEIVKFPESIGEQPTCFSLHTEPLTLGMNIKGVKVVTLKIVFPDEEVETIKPLIELGLREQEEEEQGSEICATVLWVTGLKDGKPTKLTYEYWVEHEKQWGNTKTGVPFAIGLLMLGRGQITMRGFAAPEQCINPADFIKELKKRDFIIKEIEERVQTL